MTKFSVNKVLLAYSIIGCILILYVAFIPNLTAIYAAVAIIFYLDLAGQLFMLKH